MTDVPSAELLARYHQHDAAAAEELFHRYADRLIRLARARLSRKLQARVDAEDVVLSAYRSFFLLARGGAVTVQQSGDLWRLLVRITLRKVYRNARRHLADCRSVEREEAGAEMDSDLEVPALSREPTPAEAAALTDELRSVLAPLGAGQRRIVELRLQGHEVAEIATAVQRSERTVRRILAGLGEELERRLREAARPPTAPAPASTRGALLPYSDVLLQQQLGEGGMGKVYRAVLRATGAPVAVKIIRKPLRQHGAVVARFLEEAELLARLRHPGLVAVHGLGLLPDGGHFLVMDLVEGSDLARQLACGRVSVAQALRWVSEAADALEYAHQQGVVHCDLKPSNLLLDQAGRIRVTDFGLARSLADDGPRAPAGTVGFMAPEQVDPAWGPISPRTDVHGLGAVLYALLAGQPPAAGSLPEMGALPALTPPGSPALTSLRPDVPPSVDALCQRCLAPQPQRRFASAAELAVALRALNQTR
jgi:RNA polymerase sigma factor (sigma-70 family)